MQHRRRFVFESVIAVGARLLLLVLLSFTVALPFTVAIETGCCGLCRVVADGADVVVRLT